MKSNLTSLITIAMLAVGNIAAAQGTAFTYQGHLRQGDSPATGVYDFRFALYAAPTGGSPVGGALTNAALVVSNGMFTAILDFGSGVFAGPDYWLEIAVRTNGGGAFTTLNPRQPVLPAPYAMHAGNADLLDGMSFTAFAQAAHSHSAAEIVSGALAPARGGTGVDTSATPAGSLLRTSGIGAWSVLTPGANGQVLRMSGGQPVWGADNDSGGTVTSVNTGVGLTGGPITTVGTIAIDSAVVPRLGAHNLFTGSNVFGGVMIATNASNNFAGIFSGSGSALSNLSASALSGSLPAGAIAGTYSNAVTFDNNANSFSGSFTGNGLGLSNVNAATLGGFGADQFWKTAGNGGTTAGVNFVGTTDGQPLHLKVGGVHALRFEPDPRGANVPNIIGGFSGNSISTNAGGGGNVIVGGGYVGIPNIIQSNSSGVFIGGGSLNLVGTNASDVVIAGGFGNTVEAYQSVISGGGFNSIRSVNSGLSVIGGGSGNIITNNAAPGGSATIGGGFQNYNSGWAATIAGGWQNIVTGTSDFIGGGTGNSVSNDYSSVIGGGGNVIQGLSLGSLIGGGFNNLIQTNSGLSVVGGGQDNVIQPNAWYSVIGGGWLNDIGPGADQSVISGGNAGKIRAGARESFIGGGFANVIQTNAALSFIGAGTGNTIGTNSVWGTIVGGQDNSVEPNVSHSTIGGGLANIIESTSALIGGGRNNVIRTDAREAVIAGGRANIIGPTSPASTIGGGQINAISTNTQFSTIAGGLGNIISNAAGRGFIGGGSLNTLQPFAFSGTIAGGWQNTVLSNAQYGTIGGGRSNVVTSFGFVGGGEVNTNRGFAGTISGGRNNNIGPVSDHSVIAGGGDNRIVGGQSLAVYSAIGGGRGNSVETNVQYATIPGGLSNLVAGSFGFAAGRNAHANHTGAFVWADSSNAVFASTASNQFLIRASGGVGIGTNNPTSALEVVGTVKAAAFEGNGSALSSLNGAHLAPGSVGVGALGNNVVASANVVDSSIIPADLQTSVFDTTFWKVDGNAGTTPGLHFLGTTDNQALELKVNNIRGLRLEPSGGAPNVIGGSPANTVALGVRGAFIGGGEGNVAGGDSSTVAGGVANQAAGNYASVGGGLNNRSTGVAGAVAGGENNFSAAHGFVGGGLNNVSDGSMTTVGGGRENASLSSHSTVGGGFRNRSQNDGATIAGGENNLSSGIQAAVGGGRDNISSGDSATVGGGMQNTSSGQQATVPGGHLNEAAGDYSFAAGRQAKANHPGSFVWADSTAVDFSSTAADQFSIRAAGGVRLGSDTPNLSFDGANTSILFPPTVGPTPPMIHMFRSGTGNSPRMVLAHSPTFANWGLQYDDVPDKFNFLNGGVSVMTVDLGNRRVGVGTDSPVSPLHVIGEARATVFTPTSDRNAKENFQPVDSQEILERVLSLPIARWNFKTMPQTSHIGPVAQDFHRAFSVGADDKHIATVDADGVALAAIQGLNQKVEEQRAELKRKDAELSQLKQRLDRIEKLLTTKNDR